MKVCKKKLNQEIKEHCLKIQSIYVDDNITVIGAELLNTLIDGQELILKKLEILEKKTSSYSIKTEIKKCDVRCANCHRRKTSKDLNWWYEKIPVVLTDKA